MGEGAAFSPAPDLWGFVRFPASVLFYRVLRKYVNPNCCNPLHFDSSKFTYLCKKQ
jgi:hypothetical protein